MRKLLLTLGLAFPLVVQAQDPKEITISPTQKIPEKLLERMEGVRYGDVNFTKEAIDLLINNTQTAEAQVYRAFIDYLKESCSLKYVVVTEGQRNDLYKQAASRCDFVFPSLEIGEFKSDFLAVGKVPATMRLTFCDNVTYSIQMIIGVNGNTNYYKRFKREFIGAMYVENHDTKKRLSLPTGYQIPNAEQLAKENKSSKLEGVYEAFEADGPTPERIAIYKDGDTFRVVHLSGGYFPLDWQENEQIGVLIPTASERDFKGQFNDSMKNGYNTTVSFENDNAFSFSRRNGKSYKYIRVK